jgi:hypothetical protein
LTSSGFFEQRNVHLVETTENEAAVVGEHLDKTVHIGQKDVAVDIGEN